MRPGARNLITDVAGLRVGNAEDARLKSGVTVLTADAPFAASVHVMGGAPGTRDTELLAPGTLVEAVDALALAGGSVHGLAAADGATEALAAAGRGLVFAGVRVPIVPTAILMDLPNGGDKAWGENPYRALGRAACAGAAEDFALGTAGAGTGATVAGLKGGLGSASAVMSFGATVGALVAVNPRGGVTMGVGPHFWAAPFEMAGEFGGLGPGSPPPPGDEHDGTRWPGLEQAGGNTVIAIVATDAALDPAGLQRLAMAAQDGIARAVVPSHTLLDGDLVFAASTGARPLADRVFEPVYLGHAAACCLARAIARAVHAARPAPGDMFPTWSERFGRGR